MNTYQTLLATGALLLSFNLAQAETVFTETFDGTGSLNGSTTTTGSGTWVADADYNENGTITGYGAGGAYLAYDFQDGYVYTASVQVTVGGSDGNRWGGLSFTSATDLSDDITLGLSSNSNAHLTYAVRKDNGMAFWEGPGAGGAKSHASDVSDTVTLELVLDTTGTDWTYSTTVNSVVRITPGTYTGTKDLTGVGLYMSTGAVTFDNFEFTAIPETSHAGLLMGLLAAPLAVCLRRRR
ncbi:hypothetical protein SH580_05215 [Coraliomargarita algicola]|uniref:PEP-CTERM sorting domain-containing protein n=1 Tax=Coraliomargarita algicola TaxID=3092156 RepID=A0ABZ0RQ53_9BACT|nr:hypothetical protein [Coraliomargarita sp. J2-16]WPJ97105.1 hypothetical protein SH580_05215 [Coraliomargarita sp. J2-16]